MSDIAANIATWRETLTALARSGQLAESVAQSFHQAENPVALEQLLNAVAEGEFSQLPAILTLPPECMPGMVAAYSPTLKTVYISEAIAEHTSFAIEALTHEFGHFLANRYFGENAEGLDVGAFTLSLLGEDFALMLSSAAHEPGDHAARLQPTGSDALIDVMGFKTDLHISWIQKQLPMLSAQAFNLISRGQEDTDAFLGLLDLNGPAGSKFSPYGLQFHSPSHFDNNNVRGGVEALRKRWQHGLDNLNSNSVANSANTPFADTNLVGRSFAGPDAGLENLLYRFGQITHAMQDFYSHSNWVELSRTDRKWIAADALLDSSLKLPVQLNPGDMLPNAPDVMVAMGGLNYNALVTQVGEARFVRTTNGFIPFKEKVYWWTVDGQQNWGEVYSTPIGGSGLNGSSVAALMTGAVNEAVYYSTNYSVPLRAVNKSGFFETEYYRGFSHGGGAGAFIGQWMSPLAKDSDNNGRFTDTAANAQLYTEAQRFADLQVQNDWDRLGNLIFEQHGVAGLQKFASFAVIESERVNYVATYSAPGARWDWSAANTPPQLQLLSVQASAHFAEAHDGDLRQIKVFFNQPDSNFNSLDNNEFLTQFRQGDKWVDSEVGVIGLHHDDVAVADLTTARALQHRERGGRALWTEPVTDSNSHLGSLFVVEDINPQVRVFINDFDVSLDTLRIVNAAGAAVADFDIDRADFEESRKALLDQYNILINARPELQALTVERVIRKTAGSSSVLLSAAQFFDDSNLTTAAVGDANSSPSALRFVAHDATLPWLSIRPDGLLEIGDLSKVPSGKYPLYVSVSDGATQFDNAQIVLTIDPMVSIQGTRVSPSAYAQIDFVGEMSSAMTLYSGVFDDSGRATSELHQVATRIGLAFGTPQGLSSSATVSTIADPEDNGTLRFFALLADANRLVPLDAIASSPDRFTLKWGQSTLATLQLNVDPAAPAYVNEVFLTGIDEVVIGIPLNTEVVRVDSSNDTQAHRVHITASFYREAMLDSEFGLFMVDLRTGNIVDPVNGTLPEGTGLNVNNIDRYSVFSAAGSRSGPVQRTADFTIDKDLDPDNLVLLPYLKVNPGGTPTLFFGAASANPDGISHIVKLSQNGFSCEDLVGGDYDFDDLAVIINSLVLTDYY